MPLDFAIPDQRLQPFLNAYILFEQRDPAPSQNVVPLGSQFLWAVLEGEVFIDSAIRGILHVAPVTMLGFFTHAFRTRISFPTKVAAINFKPYGCHALFGLDMINIQDHFADFSNNKTENSNMINMLKDAIDMAGIKAVLDQWLLGELQQSDVEITLIKAIVEVIEERHGNISVEELKKNFYITERTLQRLFSKAIGVNPKLYLRIQRFNYVMRRLENESDSLQEAIFDAGYFDQSHFIKDFLQFTNCNPSAFKRLEDNQISRQTLMGILKTR